MAVAPDDDVLRLAQLLAGDDEARQSAYAELETADAAVAAAPAVVNALRDSVCSTQVGGGDGVPADWVTRARLDAPRRIYRV